MKTLTAGAAVADISPRNSQFLFGYPHVVRYSTGIHDPLYSSALYLCDGHTQIIFVSCDIILLSKATVARARRAIEEQTGVPAAHIMLSATHTHSGPMTMDYLSHEDDLVIPKTDPEYVRLLEDGIVKAAVNAYRAARPAELGLAVADGTGVGTNRRNPAGPSDPQVPVLMVRSEGKPLACMVVYSMHPTVLHENSTLVSADFPGMARRYVQDHVLGADCPVIYHTGPAGNQSVRYVTRENSFAEAERLGYMLGRAIEQVLPDISFTDSVSLAAAGCEVDLPRRAFPSVEAAEREMALAAERLATLRGAGVPWQQVRKAEVDWFGAEETLTLARATAEGRMEQVYAACLPAEVQAFRVGPWRFVGWPGEMFIEYALAIKERFKSTYVISLANGELQGYIATEDEAGAGGYEVNNAVFAPATGNVLVNAAVSLLSQWE